MKERAGWLVIWLFLGVFSGTKVLYAQQDPATDFFDTVEVNVVNVEVFVSDKKGNPVAGLSQDDFEILVDGDPVEISNFYAARGQGALEVNSLSESAPPTATETKPPPPVQAPKPPDQRLNLVIFIDNINISPRTRNRVLEGLRGSLFFNLNPDDQVMLVSYDGSINIRHGLTNNVEDLMAAIDEVAQGSPRGMMASLDRSSILRELQQTDNDRDAAGLGGGVGQTDSTIDWLGILRSIQSYAAERHLNNQATIANIERFVDVLSGTVGRKALIYVSDGLELRPGEALFQAWDEKRRSSGGDTGSFVNIESEAREFDTTALFEDLGKRANSNQVTFYTILAGGGQNATATPAERSAFFDFNSPSSLGQVWSERFEAIEASNFRGSMQILAESTGGISTLNTAAFGSALKRLKRDLDTYYSLGFEADDDTENHRIKVRVKDQDRKLRLRHRESYRNKTPDERMSDLTLSALLLESEDNPLQVVVGFGEERQDEKGRFLVPIMVKFPISSLLLLPQEKFHEGRVSIYVGARDPNGGMSPVQKMPAPIRIPNDKLLTALGQVAGFRMTLLLNPGEHDVAVGVRDELANVESTTIVSHTPGTAEAGL